MIRCVQEGVAICLYTAYTDTITVVLQGPSVVNVMINPFATRKPQKFDWLTRSKL